MRRLVLLAALLAPALAHAQGAGPLADRVVDALRVDLLADNANAVADSLAGVAGASPDAGLGGFMGQMAGSMRVDGPALADSIRAAFVRADRPELVAEALGYLESPAAARFQEVMPLLPNASPFDLLGATPGADGTLADSALTARILGASLEMALDPGLQREMMTAMLGAMHGIAPDEEIREMEAEMDGLLDNPMVAQIQEMQRAFLLPLYRALLGGLPDETLRETADYVESEAGRYVTTTAMRGMLRYQLPRLFETMGAMFEEMNELPSPPQPDGND